MATNNPIPEKIRNYNVYSGPTASERILGVSNEITLPDIQFSSEEISGAGLLGSWESPNEGHAGSIPFVLPIRLPSRESLSLAAGDFAELTLRAGAQSVDIANGIIVQFGLLYNVRGLVKGINFGSAAVGQPCNAEITIEILFYKVSQDNDGSLFTLLELDKPNFVYIVNGVDKLAKLRRYI